MHALRSQIEHFEAEHGRSLSLRRAYNKLLGGAGESKSGAGESKSAGESKTEYTCVRSLTMQHRENSVCVSADGSRLFSGSWDNTIKFWSPLPKQWETLKSEISSFMESGVDSSVSNMPFRLKQALRQITLNHFREGLLNLKAEADAIGFVLPEYGKFEKYCTARTNPGAGASARKKRKKE